MSPSYQEDGFYFIPLGGSEQFGVNLNVYACDGQFLAVDCGIGFADEYFPGIDLLLPDPELLEENRDALKGMIITHAHEDHIGAVAYLWERFRCPLYCTAFTAHILERKLQEADIRDAEVKILSPGKPLELGNFKVEPLPVAHSIPDAVALVIETKYGRVMHSGDWNLDPRPVFGGITDPKAFQKIGEKGILAYIGDSTNAGVPGRAGSESETVEGLIKEFGKCEGRIAVTMFSSNIGRVANIARAARECGRDVGVIGRSLHQMIGAAKKCGYLDDFPELVPEDDLGLVPNDRLVMIVTGSQGEFRSALAKLARGAHKAVTLEKGDTVIFSARAIPGNEKSINAIKNQLVASGVEVVSPDTTDSVIHVSGHPYADEIVDMYNWVKPGCVIPVHGEREQLQAQYELAKKCQIKDVIVPRNGSVIRLAPGKPETVDHIKAELLALDQKRIIPADHASIVQRRKLQYCGTLHASLVLDARGRLLADPQISSAGLIDEEFSGEEQIENAFYEEIQALLEDMSWEERMDDHFVSEEIRIGLRRLCVHVLGIKPQTSVHVLRI